MSGMDYIRVAGLPGNIPSGEYVQGIGDRLQDDECAIWEGFDTWQGDTGTWLSGIIDQLEAAEAAYLAGEAVIELDPGTPPIIILPPPADTDNPSTIWTILKIINFFIGIFLDPLISMIIGIIIKALKSGGDISPLIKLLKKALLVKEG